MKASINGPNRRKNRAGDKTVVSAFESDKIIASSDGKSTAPNISSSIQFKVKSLERYFEKCRNRVSTFTSSSSSNHRNNLLNPESIGDACLFTVQRKKESVGGAGRRQVCSGQQLLEHHFHMIGSSEGKCSTSCNSDIDSIKHSDPILIHFHEIPIFILKALPVYTTTSNKANPVQNSTQDGNHDDEEEDGEDEEDCNIIYLSQVHCHNHKICEDTIYSITCCSRLLSSRHHRYESYDNLSAIGIEVFLRFENNKKYKSDNGNDNENHSKAVSIEEFDANDIAKKLMNHCLYSVLTVNECLVVTVDDKELVCRISRVQVAFDDGPTSDSCNEVTAAEAILEEPFRGRIMINTAFFIQTSNLDAIKINGGKVLPEGRLPDDVIHITTSDDEWFPVRRLLLAPCIHLTKYVQHGKGIYKYDSSNEYSQQSKANSKRSPDAPTDGIHCFVDIDCCTFDRVLVFIMSQMYPEEYKFALELSEMNALSHAAEVLGLLALSDLCQSQLSSFESRVRKDEYIRFSEIQKRNENNELLIIIDGMVLDITRWIDEHPGGPSIIPTQALNVDCTCFFEMYHISRQSFLYLKSFYIGELHPATQLKKNDFEPSDGFIQSLRSYSDQWRVQVEEKVDQKIHKSL